MAKGPKGRGKLAKALSGQQQAHQQRLHEERARQAEQDRHDAIKARINAGAPANKKRKLAVAAPGQSADDGKTTETLRDGPRPPAAAAAAVQPFRRGERILLVGEGNFSFAHSLLLPLSTAAAASSSSQPPPLPLVTPSLLCCTAFDSHAVAAQKYPDLASHVDALRSAGATVLFGVDATRLEDSREVRDFARLGKVHAAAAKGKEREVGGIRDEGTGFDRIVFNFPHVGQGITDQQRNVRQNQTLLIDFYRSAALLLKRGPSRAGAAGRRRSAGRNADVSDDDGDELGAPEATADDADAGEDPSLVPVPSAPSTRGTVLVTLRTGSPYSLWLPAQLATKPALLLPSLLPPADLSARAKLGNHQPAYRTVTSWAFEPARWEGYEHRRTIGWEEGRSSGKNDDLVLTARERKERRFSAAAAAAGAGAGGGKGTGASAGKKEDKGTDKAAIRTWEFELVLREDDRASGGAGGRGGAKGKARKRKAGGADDPDLDSD
ncbi:hypothetical protein Rhopal_004461-T1 [Rhodotorula paludigena]|uniref:25S rRNA (uridine-N(3))-methyltransferase BMT5-like domain-containing protein n=1 Tax=Rhodotorula paludigena TaxID=86838 RepID=A0AAV5GMK5_9BASI|nr:hypothetical protein Rhopal_004461-T1 [Rhodotorula paludigena]